MAKPLDPLQVTKANIDSYRQNRIHLVVDDLAKLGVEPVLIQRVLMARGINKWLVARGYIIRLKLDMKQVVADLNERIRDQKRKMKDLPVDRRLGPTAELFRLRGELKATIYWHKLVRSICHMPRWQPPEPSPLTLLPSTHVAQRLKIIDLQGELMDEKRETRELTAIVLELKEEIDAKRNLEDALRENERLAEEGQRLRREGEQLKELVARTERRLETLRCRTGRR